MADLFKPGSYFLSETNPVVTADQLWAERAVLRMLERQDVQDAIAKATGLWKVVSEDASEQAMALLGEAIHEFGVNYCLKAVASDPNYPRLVQNWMIDHRWLEVAMPAARIGGDNPDNCYRLMGIEHGKAYRIDGQMFGNGPADVIWSIVANAGTSMTQASLLKRDMVIADDGRFSVTIDDEPANGRTNHLQTQRGALFLFIRDTLGDWDSERPCALRPILPGEPSASPIDDDEMAWRAIDWMLRDVSLYHWFTMLSKGKPVNQLIAAEGSGGVGGIASQFATYGQLHLDDNEAFVVKVNGGGAAFRSMVAHDWWFRTIAPDDRISSRNTSETAVDDDGNFTFVISHEDPGVHNWIDTAGLRDLLVIFRWQNVADGTAKTAMPRLLGARLVKHDELEQHTMHARKITPEERQVQVKARRRQYATRLLV